QAGIVNKRAQKTRDQIRNDFEIKLMPNPAKDQVAIRFSTELTSNHRIFVTDMQGRVFYNTMITDRTSLVDLNISTWSNGLYQVSIYRNSENVGAKKLIVNH
ncbi:MAG: T9SS type A sorting domain-containing protein, partial [Chitinophagales bacterium]